MYGIAGFAGHAPRERMRTMFGAQGSDSGLFYTDEDVSLCMGCRSDAALDYPDKGNQPMTSEDGRYVLMLYGAIYNHLQLRKKAASPVRYRGESDAESLVEAVAALGLEEALRASEGKFSLCLYDKQERILHLARDKAGQKPLYYGIHDGNFFFASDLAAPLAAGIRPALDRSALALFCRHGYYPAPYTVFQGVHKLPAGHILPLRMPFHTLERPSAYWDVDKAACQARDNPFCGSEQDAVEALDGLLRQSIKSQMTADAPLGAFLSGGIDSSLISALMQDIGGRIKTFSIGFEEAAFNEAAYAKKVAEHLGTDHTEWYITANDALDVIAKLPDIYTEPFANSSQIPTCLVSSLARRQVAVSLSGDAGDELFGGYDVYERIPSAWEKAKKIPLRHAFGACALAASALPLGARIDRYKLSRGGALLQADTLLEAYCAINDQWKRRDSVVLDAGNPLVYGMNDEDACPHFAFPQETMMNVDFRLYLPDDSLVKVDRAAAAAFLDARVPMLDHRIIEFAWSLPLAYKIRNGTGKWPLRELLYRHVPRDLIDRPKKGFGVPLRAWLTGPLRPWATDLIAEDRIKRQGLFRADYIREEWKRFLSDNRHKGRSIWYILMFQAWIDRYGQL